MPDRPAPRSEDEISRVVAAILAQRPMPVRPRWFAAQRAWFWFEVVLIAALLGLQGVAFAWRAVWGWWFGFLVPIMILLGLMNSRTVGKRRAMRIVVPAGGMVCAWCHYVLPPGDASGVCPECGTRYTRDELIECWRSAYGLRDQLPPTSRDQRVQAGRPPDGDVPTRGNGEKPLVDPGPPS